MDVPISTSSSKRSKVLGRQMMSKMTVGILDECANEPASLIVYIWP